MPFSKMLIHADFFEVLILNQTIGQSKMLAGSNSILNQKEVPLPAASILAIL